MNEKESLARERARTTITDLTKPQPGDLDISAKRVSVATLVSHAVDVAYWVGSETLDGVECGSRYKSVLVVGTKIGGGVGVFKG